jgi:hypothetical protein
MPILCGRPPRRCHQHRGRDHPDWLCGGHRLEGHVGLLVRVRVQGLLFQWHGLKRHHILKINMIKFCFFKNTKHFSKSLANNFLCGVKKIIIKKKKKKKKKFYNKNKPKKLGNFLSHQNFFKKKKKPIFKFF